MLSLKSFYSSGVLIDMFLYVFVLVRKDLPSQRLIFHVFDAGTYGPKPLGEVEKSSVIKKIPLTLQKFTLDFLAIQCQVSLQWVDQSGIILVDVRSNYRFDHCINPLNLGALLVSCLLKTHVCGFEITQNLDSLVIIETRSFHLASQTFDELCQIILTPRWKCILHCAVE